MQLHNITEKVMQKKKELSLIEITKAENELLLLQRERELFDINFHLEEIFYKHSKARMMEAKFYHECVVLKIPCVLEVYTQFGNVDAIIEIGNKFLIIEFKSRIDEIYLKETKAQLLKYYKHKCPIVLVQDVACFSRLLIDLKTKNIQNKIYFYSQGKFRIY